MSFPAVPPPPFTRPTIIAACELLEGQTQASFDLMLLRLGLEQEIAINSGLSRRVKCGLVATITLQRPVTRIDTVDGPMPLAEAVVREATKLTVFNSDREDQLSFVRGLARDGYVVAWDDSGRTASLRRALPTEIDLPATDNEVHAILTEYLFNTPAGHLTQAINSHTQGRWAAANSQLRTFLESLLDEIAWHEFPAEARALQTSENRRSLLADRGFLSIARNEWSPDGKSFVHGLFRMLHTEGSHPGLSGRRTMTSSRFKLRRDHCG
jgi:hypothetical protein